MDQSNVIEFYRLLESLIVVLGDQGKPDVPKINGILTKLCQMFGISKGTTTFYESVNHERLGKGETFTCYDSGDEHECVLSVRIMSSVMAVVRCDVFKPKGAEPLTEYEKQKLDIVMRTVLNMVGRMRMHRSIEQLAYHDDKGYKNFRSYMRTIGMINERGVLDQYAAIRYNLRHFALVNQEVGRRVGDMVMYNHVAVLEKICGEGGTVCRLGGDNFVALCEKKCLDNVLMYLTESPVVYDVNQGQRILVTTSAGVWLIPDGFVLRDPGEIMDKINSAANAARTGGKDQIVFFDKNLIISKEKVMRVQQRFPEALRNEEFRVFYQPKIDIETGALAGAEALCRWFHQDQIVPPTDFIPVLEETNDICKLDFYMLEHVCMDIRRWLNEGRKVVRISVNLSRKHMMDIDLLKNIIEIVDRHHVPHQYIEIELTETTTDVEFRDLKRVVGGLQQAGIFTSVDDFGIGYSSLNLIREIPWNVLKVDKSFLPVGEDDSSSTRSIMFKYVVAMAREMGLKCIAEGVETQAQVNVLRDNHCDLAQGFFFDKPLPVERFEERLFRGHYDVESGEELSE